MTANLRKIEVDEETAKVLESRAAEKGVSVSKLVADLAGVAEQTTARPDEIAELDRRWAKAQDGHVVSGDEVVRWLETWGTPAFESWDKK